MPRASPACYSFNGGELSDLMEGRIEFEKYQTGCKLLENFIPTVQGPARNRGGTHFTDYELQADYRSWLGRFEFSYSQAFLLEFSNDRLGFFTNRGRLQVERAVAGAANNGSGLVRIESASHGFFTGDTVTVASVGGVSAANGTFVITRIDADHFDLVGSAFSGTYTSGGTATGPYSISTVYTEADLTNDDGAFDLTMHQSGDVVYIAGGGKAPQKLSRLGNTNWTIAEFQPDDGPYMDPNTNESITIYASSSSGSVTLTASSGIFTANHIGALVRLEVQNLSEVPPWEPDKAVSSGDLRRSDGKTYKANTTSDTGTVRPTHSKGKALDGSVSGKQVEWEFQDPGYGVARITAYTDSTHVTATVVKQLPAGVVSNTKPTWRWQFGAWGAHNEYPNKVALWNDRLVFAGLRTVWTSVAGDYESFAPDDEGQQLADSAVTITPGGSENNAIRWMQQSDILLIGTSGAEFTIGPQTDADPFGPANVKAPRRSAYGGKNVNALAAGEAVFVVTKSGKRVREKAFSTETGLYTSRDVTVLADHIGEGGIIDMAFQAAPHPILWAARADGQLLGFTYEKEQEVYAWHRHILGGDGLVRAVQTLPSPDGLADDVWLSVERVIDGETVRFIEWMDHGYQRGASYSSSFYVDAGLTYEGGPQSITITDVDIRQLTMAHPWKKTIRTSTDHLLVVGDVIAVSGMNATGDYLVDGNVTVTEVVDGTRFRVAYKKGGGPPTGAYISGGTFNSKAALATTISGLDHIEGQLVAILANGAVQPQQVVTGGQVTLAAGFGTVHIGLPYRARLKTMRLEAGAEDGVAQGKVKRIDHAVVRFVDTLGGFYGPDFDGTMDEFIFRRPSDRMDAPPPLFSGDKEAPWPAGYETDGCLCIEQRQPLPMTIVGIFPRMETTSP